MTQTPLKSIYRNAFYLLSGVFVNTIYRAVYVVFLARYLGPEQYGLFNFGLSWYLTFLPLTLLGIGFYLPTALGQQNKSERNQTVSESFTLVSTLCIVALPLYLIWGIYIASNTLEKLTISILSVALISRSISLWCTAIGTGYENTKISFDIDARLRLAEVVFGIALLLSGAGLTAILLNHSISWTIQALLVLRRTRHAFEIGTLFANFIKSMTLLKITAPIGIFAFLYNGFMQIPVVLSKQLLQDLMAVGQLVLTLQFLYYLTNIVIAIRQASLPYLGKSISDGDCRGALYLDYMFRFGTYISFSMGLLLLEFGEKLITLLFGSSYEVTAQLVPFCCILLIPLTWINGLWPVLYQKKHQSNCILAAAAGLLIMCFSILKLTTHSEFGIILSLFLGLSLCSFMLMMFAKNVVKINYTNAVILPLACGLFSMVILIIIKNEAFFGISIFLLVMMTLTNLLFDKGLLLLLKKATIKTLNYFFDTTSN